MTAHKTAGRSSGADVVDDQGEPVNEVRLVGRLGADPQVRELPSGDTLWTLRVVVDRPPVPPGTARRGQRVDTLECAVWAGRLKQQVGNWSAGDVVEVSGALRRRFFRAAGATASRVEVELSRGRRLRRAGSG
jgi:single-strand DNA-binding protein